MEAIAIEVESRSEKGTARSKGLRKSGVIPAVVYAKGRASTDIKLNALEFLRKTQGVKATQLFKLATKASDLDGQLVLIKQVQMEPIKETVTHIDFLAITEGTKIRVDVAISLVGEPAAVKFGEADLLQLAYQLEVECLPSDIPSVIEVDVSGLESGHSLHISDLPLPANVVVVGRTDLAVATLAAKRAEEAASVVAAPAAEGDAAKAEGAEAKSDDKDKEKDKSK
jgi:large subunit ribosomal protein L25